LAPSARVDTHADLAIRALEAGLFGTKGNLYIDPQTTRAWFQPRERGKVEQRTEAPPPPAPPEAG